MQLSLTRVRAMVARTSILAAAVLAFTSSVGAANPTSVNADITGVVTDAGSGQQIDLRHDFSPVSTPKYTLKRGDAS